MTGPKGIDWSKQPLGEISDNALAKKLGVTPSAVLSARRTRKIKSHVKRGSPHEIDWSKQPLGEISDTKIAKTLGVSVGSVRYNRTRLNIAPHSSPYTGKYAGVDWCSQPLGEVPDSVLAQVLGVSRQCVHQVRRAKGIQEFHEANQEKWKALVLERNPHLST